MPEPLTTRLRFHGRYGTESQDECAARKNREREEAADTIQAVANNLGCGPGNIVEWSAKVKAAMLELDRLQQRTAHNAD